MNQYQYRVRKQFYHFYQFYNNSLKHGQIEQNCKDNINNNMNQYQYRVRKQYLQF